MNKRVFSFALAVIMCLSISVNALADETPIKVTLDGTEIVFDQQPVIEDGRTLVPMRAIFEAMGATVEWEDAFQTVTGTKGDIVIKMQIGNNVITKNGESITLDVPPKVVNDRTLVPVRAVAESFDAKVDWNGDTQTVVITSGAAENAEPAKLPAEIKYYTGTVIENVPDFGQLTGATLTNTDTFGGGNKRTRYTYRYTMDEPVLKSELLMLYIDTLVSEGFKYSDSTSVGSTDKERFIELINRNSGYSFGGTFYRLSDMSPEGQKKLLENKFVQDEPGISISFDGTKPNNVTIYVDDCFDGSALINKYPMYKEYPKIPDFGAIFEKECIKAEQGILSSMFTYRYAEIDYSKEWVPYTDILIECGFRKTLAKNNSGDDAIYYVGFGYSITIFLGRQNSDGSYYIPKNPSISVQSGNFY